MMLLTFVLSFASAIAVVGGSTTTFRLPAVRWWLGVALVGFVISAPLLAISADPFPVWRVAGSVPLSVALLVVSLALVVVGLLRAFVMANRHRERIGRLIDRWSKVLDGEPPAAADRVAAIAALDELALLLAPFDHAPHHEWVTATLIREEVQRMRGLAPRS